jgi:hypothetical protein
VPGRRRGLAREQGLVDLEVVSLEQPGVRTDDVPLLDQQHVAGDEGGGRDGLHVAVPPDAGRRGGEGSQRGDRPQGPAFLDDAHRRVDGDDERDHRRVGDVRRDERQAQRDEQDHDHGLAQLCDHGPPEGGRPLQAHVVRARLRQSR